MEAKTVNDALILCQHYLNNLDHRFNLNKTQNVAVENIFLLTTLDKS